MKPGRDALSESTTTDTSGLRVRFILNDPMRYAVTPAMSFTTYILDYGERSIYTYSPALIKARAKSGCINGTSKGFTEGSR